MHNAIFSATACAGLVDIFQQSGLGICMHRMSVMVTKANVKSMLNRLKDSYHY